MVKKRIIVELKVPFTKTQPLEEMSMKLQSKATFSAELSWRVPVNTPKKTLSRKPSFIEEPFESSETTVIRGFVEENRVGELKAENDVLNVWNDCKVAPYPLV